MSFKVHISCCSWWLRYIWSSAALWLRNCWRREWENGQCAGRQSESVEFCKL